MNQMPKKFLLLLSTLLYFSSPSISFASFSADQTRDQTSDQEPERIIVYGNRSAPLIKKQMVRQMKSFYRLFNQFNEDRRYSYVCLSGSGRGSNMADRACEPRNLRDLRSHAIRGQIKRNSLKPVAFMNELRKTAEKERAAAKENMMAVIQRHPELKEEFLKLNELVQAWNSYQ